MYRIIIFAATLTLAIQLAKAEEIIIASGEYPPWTSKNMEFGGLINRTVKLALERAGYSVKFEYMPWKRALEVTRLGRAHATSFWSKNDER